jgi:hypothetical protein
MSFTRLRDDRCTYSHDLRQAIGPGQYQLAAPRAECHACFSPDPTIRLDRRGAAVCDTIGGRVDAHSELLGITRRASQCPTDKFLPGPAGPTGPTPAPASCALTMPPDCAPGAGMAAREDTRLSNPPCTLRGTGWNRWEWLCRDPQDKALVPFEWGISYRTVVKDNHRPCVPTPLGACAALPGANGDDRVFQPVQAPPPTVDVQLPSTHWRKCSAYQGYFDATAAGTAATA